MKAILLVIFVINVLLIPSVAVYATDGDDDTADADISITVSPSNSRKDLHDNIKKMRDDMKAKEKAFREDMQKKRESFFDKLKDNVKNTIEKKEPQFGAHITGKVTIIADTGFSVEQDSKTYNVLVSNDTNYRRRFWGKSSLDEYSVGDTVNVIGKWNNDAKTEIKARLVRNLSIQKRAGAFIGEITSKSDTSFVLKTKNRGDQTVLITGSVQFVDRNGAAISYSSIQVGNRVKVKGVWNNTSNQISEVTQVRDFSLPVKPSVTPTVTSTPTPTVTTTPSPTPTSGAI